MFKYNKPAHNEAERSFRELLTLPCMKDVKKDLVHNLKNMCEHSNTGNIFANYCIKGTSKVKLARRTVGSNRFDALRIELDTNRKGTRKAFLMLAADKDLDGFPIEIHVHFWGGIKSVYTVPNDKLRESLIIALG